MDEYVDQFISEYDGEVFYKTIEVSFKAKDSKERKIINEGNLPARISLLLAILKQKYEVSPHWFYGKNPSVIFKISKELSNLR